MKIFIIKLIFAGCTLLGIFLVVLGIYKISIKGEQISIRYFLHIPLNSKSVIYTKAPHNIIDGIGFVLLGVGGYLIFYHYSWR
jgi:hypothetical protein